MEKPLHPGERISVACLLLLWGWLTLAKSYLQGHLHFFSLSTDLMALALPVGLLLLCHVPFSQLLARLMTYYGLLGGLFWLLELFPLPWLQVTSFGKIPDLMPVFWQRVCVLPFLAAHLWQFYVLTWKKPARSARLETPMNSA